MKTFRAYLHDEHGKIAWAAWIEAAGQAEAESAARQLRPGTSPEVDLWLAAERGVVTASELEPI